MLISANISNEITLYDLKICVFILLLTVSNSVEDLFPRSSCTNTNNSCFDVKFPDQIENAVCYKDQVCSEYDPRSSCNLFSPFELLSSVLKEVKIFRNDQILQIEVVLELSPHPTFEFPDSGVFIFEVLVGSAGCRQFSLPSSQIPQSPFNLPCLRTNLLHGHLDLQLSTSLKLEDGTSEVLSIHKQSYVISKRKSSQSFEVQTLYLSYSFDHLKFYLTLQNVAFDGCEMSYQVTLLDSVCNGHDVETKPLYSWSGDVDRPLLVLNCSKTMLEYFKKYCASVSLKPSTTCARGYGKRREMLVFQYIPEKHLFEDDAFSSLLCSHWNVSMLLKSDSSMQKISVHLRLCTGMKRLSGCYKFYLLYLYLLRSGACHPTSGIRIHSTQLVIPYNETVTRLFSALTNGYYCVLLVPCSSNYDCHEDRSLHSNAVRISAMPHARGVEDYPSTTSDSTVFIMALVSSSVFVVFIVAVLLLLRCRHKRKSPNLSTLNPSMENDIILEEQLPIPDSSVEVLLLYYPDTETTRQVSLLREFLRDCARLRVAALDESFLPEMMVNRAAAMQKMLQYRCSSVGGVCDSGKRLVVVESRTAMQYLQCRLQEDKRKRWHREDNSNQLECSLFCEAVSTLLSDWRKCLGDYCHLFVVRFDDPLRYEAEILLTTFDRYDLPRDLVRLCLNLGCCAQSREILEQRKEGHPINYL